MVYEEAGKVWPAKLSSKQAGHWLAAWAGVLMNWIIAIALSRALGPCL